MTGLGRIPWTCKWLALGASVGILALMILSEFGMLFVYNPLSRASYDALLVSDGTLMYSDEPVIMGEAQLVKFLSNDLCEQFGISLARAWWPHQGIDTVRGVVVSRKLPLWIIAAGLGTLAWTFHSICRTPPWTSHCVCGYDLAGLQGPKCPECGKVVGGR